MELEVQAARPKNSRKDLNLESNNKPVKRRKTALDAFPKPTANGLANGVAKKKFGDKVSTPIVRPDDWPAATGAIDLTVQDLPHASANTEWWYVNGHGRGADGKEYSYFASFFRIVKQWEPEVGEYSHMHALSWGIVDPQTKRYHTDGVLDREAPWALKEEINSGRNSIDPRRKRALLEVLDKGKVPLPDRLFEQDVNVATDKLALDFGGNYFTKDAQGRYKVHCVNKEKGMELNLTIAPKKKVVRQGRDGVVKVGVKGEDMFYYFIPRCEAEGSIAVDGKSTPFQGSSWYDHEFGGTIKASKSKDETKVQEEGKDFGWNWLSLQLEDGTDITHSTVFDPNNNMKVVENYSVVVGPDGTRTEYTDSDTEFKPLNSWMSLRTTNDFPTKWQLSIPSADIQLSIEAAFEQQEFETLISKSSFWEGRMNVQGKLAGKAVKGLGFVERHGTRVAKLEDFFKRVSKMCRKEIHKLLPLKPGFKEVRDLMADEHNEHYLDGVDTDVFSNLIIKPIREIVDRGGKAWRSYALILCLDCVGGNSYDYAQWLAMPEIMHVGSLIIDDIQDKSETRRGGPACHKIFGEALSINAGTAAYFLALDALCKATPNLSDSLRVTIYEKYFLTLRAGHAGQAFDIFGLDYLIDEAVETGENARLVSSVVCTHRLKSAVPAGNLARMGCLIGKGSPEQQEVMGRYFESVGIAFQIIDDVLNLRGLPGKVHGEDIMAGKVTYPVALAMDSKRLSREQRESLWKTIRSKPQDPKVVDSVIKIIEDCGALQESEDTANRMVEEAWKDLDPALPDSTFKLNIRAFGFFVLHRHY